MGRAEQLFGIDLRSLAAFRIGLGALLLADLIYRGLDFQAHYTDQGVLPRGLYLELFADIDFTWSAHLLHGSATYTALLFLAQALAGLALLLGIRTRWAVLVSWLLLVSLHNRQPLVVSGSDLILRLLLFWSLFLPLDGAPSGDQRRGEAGSPAIELSPASVALLAQVFLIYAFSLIHKLNDPAWTEFSAMQSAMQVEGVATALGRELLAYPELLRMATGSTLAVEFAMPLLVFVPFKTMQIRVGVVIAMWAFHLFGIGGTMNLGLFEYVMALAWVPFLPPLFWDRVAPGWSPTRSGVEKARTSRAEIVRGVSVVLALALVIIDNVVSLDRSQYQSAPFKQLRVPTRALALSQQWRLWSTPLRNRYYVFPACLADRTEVDLHTGRALDWDHPRRASRNNHWWKYQLILGQPGKQALRPAYGKVLIREWNREHPAEQHVVSLEIVKIDASGAEGSVTRDAEPAISTLPRRVLWRSRTRPFRCRV